MKKADQPKSYIIKITLMGSKPSIWRRFCVPGKITLDRLHDVIQIVMGWEESHLHRFTIDGRTFSENPEEDVNDAIEADVVLKDMVREKGTKFIYVYDFGDGWEHELLVEGMEEVPQGHGACVGCMDGKRACPPEDIGGIHGFAEYLKVLKNPKDSEHESYLEWRGPFDPLKFDLDLVNFELAKYCHWSRPRLISQELFPRG